MRPLTNKDKGIMVGNIYLFNQQNKYIDYKRYLKNNRNIFEGFGKYDKKYKYTSNLLKTFLPEEVNFFIGHPTGFAEGDELFAYQLDNTPIRIPGWRSLLRNVYNGGTSFEEFHDYTNQIYLDTLNSGPVPDDWVADRYA